MARLVHQESDGIHPLPRLPTGPTSREETEFSIQGSHQYSLPQRPRDTGIQQSRDSPPRRPLPSIPSDPSTRLYNGPLFPVQINKASDIQVHRSSSAQIENCSPESDPSKILFGQENSQERLQISESALSGTSWSSAAQSRFPRNDQSRPTQQRSAALLPAWKDARSESPRIVTPEDASHHHRKISNGTHESTRSEENAENWEYVKNSDKLTEVAPPLQYFHSREVGRLSQGQDRGLGANSQRNATQTPPLNSTGHNVTQRLSPTRHSLLEASLPRPASGHSSTSDVGGRARARSPQFSPNQYGRGTSAQRRSPQGGRSPETRPLSFIDLLNVPYPQPAPAATLSDNAHLRTAVGNNASLLSTTKTLEMYRANVKKTNDPAIQYEFAIFMITTAQELAANGGQIPTSVKDSDGSTVDDSGDSNSSAQLLREARHILQRLSDRSYPFAQYYLADGYASGMLNKGREDNEKAFPLFVAASKHGHAEAGYRAALCYEFGWGARSDPQKAVQFYRQSASKNHPGAMLRLGNACLNGDLGLGKRYREGLKWLKRAAESADFQYNSAPYELGLLYEQGDGNDVFRDESYAAQLFTQSADLGHAEANYRLGEAYEHGYLTCPKDPALSVHFYTGAAQRGYPMAMMALCAWYMVGAEPVLEKDENESYEWAKKAAESGLPKAEYAVGWFTEMGLGCRRDPLEANVWYVRAADHGDERAKHRIAAIRAAASGGSLVSSRPASAPQTRKGKTGSPIINGDEEEKGKHKRWGLF